MRSLALLLVMMMMTLCAVSMVMGQTDSDSSDVAEVDMRTVSVNETEPSALRSADGPCVFGTARPNQACACWADWANNVRKIKRVDQNLVKSAQAGRVRFAGYFCASVLEYGVKRDCNHYTINKDFTIASKRKEPKACAANGVPYLY
jgi:hypothetical protein